PRRVPATAPVVRGLHQQQPHQSAQSGEVHLSPVSSQGVIELVRGQFHRVEIVRHGGLRQSKHAIPRRRKTVYYLCLFRARKRKAVSVFGPWKKRDFPSINLPGAFWKRSRATAGSRSTSSRSGSVFRPRRAGAGSRSWKSRASSPATRRSSIAAKLA